MNLDWKIQRDVYMSSVAGTWGPRGPWEAGFFVDSSTDSVPLNDVNWLTTTVSHLSHNRDSSSPEAPRPKGTPIVLLATGGFFPLHAGHVDMMATARKIAEENDWWIIGGYLSPGHDEYLQQKWQGRAPVASTRVSEVANHLSTYEHRGWLRVDPWEALHCPVAVNYTDVVARMQAYLRAHVDPLIEVCYVCGGDNARFSLAFSVHGRCIVVNRPGYESEFNARKGDPRNAHDRVLWGTEPGVRLASHDLEPATAPLVENQRSLTIRLDDLAAVRTLGLEGHVWTGFQRQLHALFVEYLSPPNVVVTDSTDLATCLLGLEDELIVSNRDLVVSNDPYVSAPYNVGVSRKFEIGGYHQQGHVVRPGWPTVSEQIDALPFGKWTVIDDDVASGATRNHLGLMLGEQRPVERFISTITHSTDDLVDSRDFLLGADDAGLVIELPDGTIGRAPYVLPYVDPSVRASIPGKDALDFSLKVWEINAQLFAETQLKLIDLPPPIRQTLQTAGFDDQTRLADICLWHAEGLRRNICPGAARGH